MKQVADLLKDHQRGDQLETITPSLRLWGKRLRKKELAQGLYLMFLKATRPRTELWRIGAWANISESYAKEVNPRGPRKTTDSVEAQDRSMLTKVTSRALKKYELIAENSARGRFPCSDPVQTSDFNYAELGRMAILRKTWEKHEKRNLERHSLLVRGYELGGRYGNEIIRAPKNDALSQANSCI